MEIENVSCRVFSPSEINAIKNIGDLEHCTELCSVFKLSEKKVNDFKRTTRRASYGRSVGRSLCIIGCRIVGQKIENKIKSLKRLRIVFYRFFRDYRCSARVYYYNLWRPSSPSLHRCNINILYTVYAHSIIH